LLLGTLGANIVRVGFIAALAAAFFYYRAHRNRAPRTLWLARNSYHLARLSLISAACLLSGLGQLLWWKHSDTGSFLKSLAGAAYIPATFKGRDGRTIDFALRQMMPNQDDPSKSQVDISVKLPTDMGASKKQETLVIEASIKPMINLVWAGTVTLVIGFFLTIVR
jgi:hypothetical protein